MIYNYIYLILVLSCAVCFSIVSSKAPRLACYYLTLPRYYPSPMSYLPENIPVELCDELVYFHVELNENTFDIDYTGVVVGDINNVTKLRSNVSKVIVAIGGYGRSLRGFSALFSPEKRTTFVGNIISFMQNHHFNGLLIDWAYPGEKETADKTTYVELVKDLRVQFRKLKYKLAITGPSDNYYITRGYNVSELSKYVDSFHVKSYDMWGPWKSNASLQNPLYQVSSIHAEDKYSVKDTMDMWVNHGAPKKKLFVGLKLFGTTFQLSEGADGRFGSKIEGKGKKNTYSLEGEITYYEICAKLMSGGSWIEMWNDEGLVPYAFDFIGERKWASYENPRSAFEKAKFVSSEGYGGMYVYGVSVDDFRGLCGPKHGLTKAVHSVLKNQTL